MYWNWFSLFFESEAEGYEIKEPPWKPGYGFGGISDTRIIMTQGLTYPPQYTLAKVQTLQ
jgi:hypothetical protein